MAFFLWGLLALGLSGALVFSSQLEFLVPAVAAIFVLGLALVPGLGDAYLLQTVVWLLLSAGGLVVFRDQLRRLKHSGRKAVEDSVSGKLATVTEAIGEEGGRVKFQGTTWKAQAVGPVPVGATVTVLSQDGLVLFVEAQESDRVEEAFKALEAEQTPKEG